MQTVYVDLYFFINFSMDFLCLYLTSKLLSQPFSLLRIALAATLGGLYADLSLFLSFGGVWGILFDILSLILICVVAFGKIKNIGRLPLCTVVFVAVSAALGGIMTALYYLFNRTGIFDFMRGGDGDGISVWLFALLAAVSAVLTLAGGRGAAKKMSASDVELEITVGGKTVSLRGMTDSGNLLREPVSGKPCIVADARKLRRIIPQELRDREHILSRLSTLRGDTGRRIVLIPAVGATGESMLVGLRAERVLIKQDGRVKDADAIIALSELEVDALVPSCLLI